MRKNKSAIKRAEQNEKRRLRNSHVKSTMKTRTKKVLQAIGEKEVTKIEETFKSAIVYIGKAASKGVIHKNNASRRVSRLSKKVHEATKTEQK